MKKRLNSDGLVDSTGHVIMTRKDTSRFLLVVCASNDENRSLSREIKHTHTQRKGEKTKKNAIINSCDDARIDFMDLDEL